MSRYMQYLWSRLCLAINPVYTSCREHMELHVSWQFTSNGTYYTSHATPRLVKIKISKGNF